MAGLIAVFNPDGVGPDANLSGLAARFPSHAGRRASWRDDYLSVVRLYHDGDRAKGGMPYWNDAGTLGICHDGEIFDADDLPPGPDAWLHLIEDGEFERFASLDGSFSLIAYDRLRRRLMLISDRHGSRPLYYFTAGKRIVVASHVAALTAHSKCPRGLNTQSLHEVVALQRILGNGTIYSGVERLEPATVQLFDQGTASRRRYWSMRWREPDVSRRDMPRLLAERLRTAVRRRMPEADRPGLLLSGGLDSRGILAVADRPECFSQAMAYNRELWLAETAARSMGARFTAFTVTPEDYARHFDEAVRLSGGMHRAEDAHFLPTLPRIRERCNVLVSGYLFDAIYRGHELPQRRLRLMGYRFPLPFLERREREDLASKFLASASYALPVQQVGQILSKRARAEHQSRMEAALASALADFDQDGPDAALNAMDWLSLRSVGQDEAFLNALSIRAWMNERSIALDRDLFDAYLGMPPRWRYPDQVYREALALLLPPSLARLRSADTGLAPLQRAVLAIPSRAVFAWYSRRSGSDWYMTSWPNFNRAIRDEPLFRQRVLSLPRSAALMDTELFDPEGVSLVVNKHMSGQQNCGRLLLQLLAIESWINQFSLERVA